MSSSSSISASTDSKQCLKCQDVKELSEFNIKYHNKDNLDTLCRNCRNEYYRLRRKRKTDDDNGDSDGVEETEAQDSLYVMRNPRIPGMVKIGRSKSPEERRKQLSQSHPFELVLCHTYGECGHLEKTVHNKLKHRRVEESQCREWFWVEPWQADAIIQGVKVANDLKNAPIIEL